MKVHYPKDVFLLISTILCRENKQREDVEGWVGGEKTEGTRKAGRKGERKAGEGKVGERTIEGTIFFLVP